MKNNLLKVIIAAMIITIFTTSSLFQPIASAAVNSPDIILDSSFETEITKETDYTTQDLPPRNPAKDPFYVAFGVAMAAIVGVTAAETLVSNAVNNGIEWTCNKYGHITGVKQACWVFKP